MAETKNCFTEKPEKDHIESIPYRGSAHKSARHYIFEIISFILIDPSHPLLLNSLPF